MAGLRYEGALVIGGDNFSGPSWASPFSDIGTNLGIVISDETATTSSDHIMIDGDVWRLKRQINRWLSRLIPRSIQRVALHPKLFYIGLSYQQFEPVNRKLCWTSAMAVLDLDLPYLVIWLAKKWSNSATALKIQESFHYFAYRKFDRSTKR